VVVLQMALAQIRAYGPAYEAAMVAASVDDYVSKVVVRGGVLGSDPWAVPGARVGRDTTSFAGIAGINHERKSAATGASSAAAANVVARDPGIAQQRLVAVTAQRRRNHLHQW